MQAKQIDVVIIGTGFGGLGMAIQLKKRGRDSFVLLEKAGDVGGTWRDNTYPGCACDVQSHLYSYSFEPNPGWSRMFAPQGEILDYLRGCADKYGIRPHIRFNTEAVRAEFDEAKGRWLVTTENGDTYSARALVSAVGALSRPAYPKLKGLERFAGETFHSQQWNHDYDLRGKRVAVIGTGASAIQFVPAIQPRVARLDLYQRTPPWILPKPDRRILAAERKLFEAFPLAQKLARGSIYVKLEARVLGFVMHPKVMEGAKLLALAHIRRQVKDPALRKKLTPNYAVGCKRILMADNYYPALAQKNVDVLTTGIREVTERGIVGEDGALREVDAIIYGTGFQVTEPIPRGMVFGLGGQELMAAWRSGPEAHKGTTVTGFPNLYVIMGPNTGLGHSSMVYMIESQIHYAVEALEALDREGADYLDVRPEAQAAYNARIQSKLKGSVWNEGGCNSWYLDPASGKNVSLWPGFTFMFRRETRAFDLQNYRVVSARRKAQAPARPLSVATAR